METSFVEEAEQRRDAGIDVASCGHAQEIATAQLQFLKYLVSRQDGVGCLDDASTVEELATRHNDASRGKWRGQISRGLVREGLIESVGAVRSLRRFRNRGLVTQFRLCSRDYAEFKINALHKMLAAIN